MDVGSARRLRRHQPTRWTIAVALVGLTLGLVAALAAPAVAGAAGAPSWVKRLSGDGRADATYQAAAVSNHGMVYAVGSAELDRASGADAVLAKYDPSGKRLWLRHWTSKGKHSDTFDSVVLDSSGNVYAAGRGPAAPSPSTRLVVAKYAADGRRLWVSTYWSSLWVVSTTPIAVDHSGDSYVCVMETGIDSSAWVTLKYGRGGHLLWRKVWAPSSAGQPRVFPSDLAIDPAGDVYETGALYTWNGAINLQQCATVKYTSAGKRQWIKLFAAASDDKNQGTAICFAGGQAYVAGQGGRFEGSHHRDAFALSYAPDGTLDWSRTWAPPGGVSAQFQDVVADGSGNAYACGSVADGAGGSDGAVVGFDATGAVSWATPVDIGDHDAYASMTRAANGALVATGTADDMLTLARLVPSTGAIDLSVSWKGQSGEIDRGLAVATSAGGDIYVGGDAKPPAKHQQALLLKY